MCVMYYWGVFIFYGQMDFFIRENVWCVFEDSRKLLNVVMRSCRNVINNFKVFIVYCDKFYSLCGIIIEQWSECFVDNDKVDFEFFISDWVFDMYFVFFESFSG